MVLWDLMCRYSGAWHSPYAEKGKKWTKKKKRESNLLVLTKLKQLLHDSDLLASFRPESKDLSGYDKWTKSECGGTGHLRTCLI